MDRVRELMGDDAANSLEQLAQLTKMLEEQGLIHQKDGRLELTPKGLRKIGNNALRDLYTKLAKDKAGQHQTHRLGYGHERTYETKQYEFGDPFQLDLHRTVRNAIRRQGPGTPVRLSPDDPDLPAIRTYVEARYEDLVRDPETTLRRICEFVDLPWEEEMLRYHERAAERLAEMAGSLRAEGTHAEQEAGYRIANHAPTTKPPDPAKLDKWRREMSPGDLAAYDAVAGELLSELGYEVTS